MNKEQQQRIDELRREFHDLIWDEYEAMFAAASCQFSRYCELSRLGSERRDEAWETYRIMDARTDDFYQRNLA